MLTFQGYSPNKSAIGVSRTAPVYFEVRASIDEAINVNTVNVIIDSQQVIVNGQFQANFSGIIAETVRGIDVYITHVLPFNAGDVIHISTVIMDIEDSYSFTTATSDTVLPAVIANPKGGLFASTQGVSLIVSKIATTYYTLDGSTPTESSSVYSAPLNISENTTLKFFSKDTENNISYIHVEIYQFTQISHVSTLPVTTVNVASGAYNELKSVTLTTDRPATIYWTLNGPNPTVDVYTGKDTSPISIVMIDGVNVLKFFAVDSFSNVEQFKTETYVIEPKENNVVPTNVFVTNPYIKNTTDICWDDMTQADQNVIGYNIYRSQVDANYLQNLVSHDELTANNLYSKNDETFIRINPNVVSTTFYRDQTINRMIIKEDVSSQFKHTTLVDASTDFSGQIVDANKWEVIDDHQLFSQSNGLNFIDIYGNNRDAYCQSKFRLQNDFDVETHFTLSNWPVTDVLSNQEVAFIVSFSKFTFVKISRLRREAFDYYVMSVVVDSQEVDRHEVPTVDMNGKFRIIRSASTITTLYYDGLVWIILNSYLNFSQQDLQVKFYVKSSNKQIDVLFKYFNLISGKASLPLIKDIKGQYYIQLQHYPIIGNPTLEEGVYNLNACKKIKQPRVCKCIANDNTQNVQVLIDNVPAVIQSIDSINGNIILNTDRVYDYVLSKYIEPPVPTAQSIVTVTYQYLVSNLKLNVGRFPFYKVTAVLSDGSETRLSWCSSVTFTAEKIDWMYQEAMRRNSWLLDQTGERVLIFIRKTSGEKCICYRLNERTHKQPKVGSCKVCWGTGIVGGYEGPYEIRIAPFKSEQRINMTVRGMKLENTEETWTSISPAITQRDFILRRNGNVYAIGGVSQPEVKGVAVQQHFSVEYVDNTDIRYEFARSLDLFNYSSKIGLRKPHTHYTDDVIVENGEFTEEDRNRTNKSPDLLGPKGRTVTFENNLS